MCSLSIRGCLTMKQKEFVADDFVAEEVSFPVEVKDRKGQVLKSAQLKVAIDDGDEQTVKPETNGTFNIKPQPKDKLTITGVTS